MLFRAEPCLRCGEPTEAGALCDRCLRRRDTQMIDMVAAFLVGLLGAAALVALWLFLSR